MRDITVVDKGYILSGASGRNGGGVRAQWTTRDNIIMARESISMFKGLSEELGINNWFRQGGYLFLAYDDEKRRALEKSAAFQRQHGVPTRMVDAREARKIVPGLAVEKVVGASYNPTDGIIFPWPVVWGYWQRCRERGVKVMTGTTVTGFGKSSSWLYSVKTDKGELEADLVVNAAGGWAKGIAALADVKLPNTAMRHEILVTEPLKAFLGPMVVDTRNGLYFNQVMRGEIVAGISNPTEKPGINSASSLEFMKSISKAMLDVLPGLRSVSVVRQWAGLYDLTPDGHPIIGSTPDLMNMYQLNGFSGHGFMLSPFVTNLAADAITGKRTALDMSRFSLERFAKGDVEKETMVIG